MLKGKCVVIVSRDVTVEALVPAVFVREQVNVNTKRDEEEGERDHHEDACSEREVKCCWREDRW